MSSDSTLRSCFIKCLYPGRFINGFVVFRNAVLVGSIPVIIKHQLVLEFLQLLSSLIELNRHTPSCVISEMLGRLLLFNGDLLS